MRLVSFDTETDLMAPGNVTPNMVCASFAMRGEDGEAEAMLLHQSDERLHDLLYGLLTDEEVHFVGAFIAFDMCVVLKKWPHLAPEIWEAYFQGRIHDVQLQEKLHFISTTGDIEYLRMPDGSQKKINFTLADIEKRVLGVDRSEDKEGDDTWRMRYGELMNVPISEWEEDAVNYAIEDAYGPLFAFEQLDENKGQPGSYGSIETEPFQAAADFALRLATVRGLPTDPERVERLAAALEREIGPEVMQPLYDAGLLDPAKPGRPYKTNPKKFTKAKPEKRNDKLVRAYVEKRCAELGVAPKFTKTKQVSIDSDILEQLMHAGDELCGLLHTREHYQKLRSTYLPVLRNPVVHFNFNALVTSGRTSSYGHSKKKVQSGTAPYPATNGQNQPRIGGDFSVRECFVARPGTVLVSIDYGSLELCGVAQTTNDLFPGKSVHFEKVNAGYDMHGYLAAQLATHLTDEFGRIVRDNNLSPDEAYNAFMAFKKHENPELREFFGHWRTFAKPTGLGYPGGLGPKTFIEFARATYGVEVDLQTAEMLREIWFSTYPEMRLYFDWVTTQADPKNVGLYRYISPMGMLRSGCGFTEMANGKAMQTPAGEGAKGAVFRVQRCCHDPSQGSILYGTSRMVDFIHDELLMEMDDDAPDLRHERVKETEGLMVRSMKVIMPDVNITVESAMMRRWYKKAEPVYDNNGLLIPWEPKQ